VGVTPGRVERPDLVLEMSPDTFVRMLARITNPMVLMLTHKIRVKGFGKMGAFGKLFPTPQPERVLNLAIAPAVAVRDRRVVSPAVVRLGYARAVTADRRGAATVTVHAWHGVCS